MKTVLITGGCGFIGSSFIRHFLKSHPDWKIINLDKLTYAGNRANTREFERSDRYEFVLGDICDPGTVHSLAGRVQAIVHFAAETHVDRSIESVDDFLMTNVFGTRLLLEAARRHSVEKFLHVSTDEVYGSIDEGAADEDAPLKPNSPYAASKAAADLLIRSYWVTFRFPAMIVRCTNTYGPNQYPEKAIPLFVTNLLENKKIPLYGDGKNRRTWMYSEDTCRGIDSVFEKGKPMEIYNIGTDDEMCNIDVVKAILKLMECGDDKIQFVADRPGHDFRYSIDHSKIKKLGFSPATSFQDGLKKTVDWYTNNREWWQPLKRDKFTVK